MKQECRNIQNLLAADGVSAVRDDAAIQSHLEECADCFALLEACSDLDGGLAALGSIDAPDAVVETLLARPELAEAPASGNADTESSGSRLPGWLTFPIPLPRPAAWGGAAAAVLVLVVGSSLFVNNELVRAPLSRSETEVLRHAFEPKLTEPVGNEDFKTELKSLEEPLGRKLNRGDLDQNERYDYLPRTVGERDSVEGEIADQLEALGYIAGDSLSKETGWERNAAKDDAIKGKFGMSTPQADPKPKQKKKPKKVVPMPTPSAASPAPEGQTVGGNVSMQSEGREAGVAGGLSVQVVDSNGVLPGATVTISHDAGNVQTTAILTDKDGRAQFPVLRSGDGYNLDVQFPGFGPRRIPNVTVQGSENTPVTVQLAEAITERVRVVAETDVVDLKPGTVTATSKFSDEFIQDLPVPGRYYENALTLAPGVGDADGDDAAPSVHGSRDRDFKAVVSGIDDVEPLTGGFMSRVNPNSIEQMEVVTSGSGVEFSRARGGFANIVADNERTSTAQAFLAERASLEGLSFKQPRGYWANAYVPGDPALRLLQSKLVRHEPSLLAGIPGAPFGLHEAARQTTQPFDPPRNAALAVYLHGDRRGISEKGRMLVQVGLQATERRGGTRPPMRVGVVLDLRNGASDDVTAGMRAVVRELGKARNTGDRFCLTVAGRPGGRIVEPANFRHGYLAVTLGSLFDDGEAGDAPVLSLASAFDDAFACASGGDGSTGTLGSSAVVLLTGGALGSELDGLTRQAHRSAVDGVQVSVIGVGHAVVPAEIDRVTLAGQGSRRLLGSPAEAAALVERELAAVGRVVARAVRLRIRLAPGVELVDVFSTRHLEEHEAQEVRAAEQSIDRRIARDTGIEADRGEDEDGIQIVIPAFYAGDSHTILLDVVAPGPGAVADVVARFKDLVHLRNGEARDSLSLGNQDEAPGPLERNVLKNLLALQLSESLAGAGDFLAGGNAQRAAALLGEFRALLAGLRTELPELGADPDLERDIAMLDEYTSVLTAEASHSPELVALLSDSLRYAAWMKVMPSPAFH